MNKPIFNHKDARFGGRLEDGRECIVTDGKWIWAINLDGTIEYEGYVLNN
jgi:hypothetical protein